MAAQPTNENNATLSVSVLRGKVDPLKWGTKVYVEARLGNLLVRRLSPVSVDPATGDFAYESAADNLAVFNNNTLEEIFEETLHVVLRSWSPSSSWVDSAQIRISVRSISIDAPAAGTTNGNSPAGGGRNSGGSAGRENREYMLFGLEPMEGDGGAFKTDVQGVPNLVFSATIQSRFRQPVESVARILQGCASNVDLALDTVSQQTERVTPYLSSRAALVPKIPAGIVVLASLPLICVLGVAGFPLLVPMLVIMTILGIVGALLAAAVWLFSRGGRACVQRMVRPVYEKVGRQDPEVLYPTGPGPSPARIARCLVPTGMWGKLLMSMAVDAIGCSSYAVPGLGESADLVWAPISYLLIDAMYHNSTPWAAAFGGIEELLPFTDIIPTATLAWMKEYLPQMLRRAENTESTGLSQSRAGDVYHSNDAAGPGGVVLPSLSGGGVQ
ncbi:unnamed protein product [Scytosiphon promiscuus]